MKIPALVRTRLPAAGALVLGLALAGCGGDATTPFQRGDAGGTRIVAFSSNRGGQYDVFLYDLDQLGFRHNRAMADPVADERNPSLSADGGFVAFERDRGATGADLFIYERAGDRVVEPPNVNTAAAETAPAFTGDVLKLAFVREVAGYKRVLMIDGVPDTLMSLPGLGDTTVAYHDDLPAPNQDGSLIAFVSDRNGNPDVFVWQRGVGVRDIPELRSDSVDTEPAISRDGVWLCFASSRAGGEGGFDLYLYHLPTGTLTRPDAPNTAAHERNPTLSRFGHVVCFESNRAGSVGGTDVWNWNSTSGEVGQGFQESSTAEDLAPSLLWP